MPFYPTLIWKDIKIYRQSPIPKMKKIKAHQLRIDSNGIPPISRLADRQQSSSKSYCKVSNPVHFASPSKQNTGFSATGKSWKKIKSFANLLQSQTLQPINQNNSGYIPRQHKTKLRWELDYNLHEQSTTPKSATEPLQSVLKNKYTRRYGQHDHGYENHQPTATHFYDKYQTYGEVITEQNERKGGYGNMNSKRSIGGDNKLKNSLALDKPKSISTAAPASPIFKRNHDTSSYFSNTYSYPEPRSKFLSESLGGAKFRKLYSHYQTEEGHSSLEVTPKTDQMRELRLTDFWVGECKGEGRFGKVHMAIHKKTGFLCALKKVKKEAVRSMVEQFIQEMKIQLFLNHPRLVKIYGYFCDTEHIYMLIEYMEDGSLYTLMKKRKRLEQREAIQKLNEICEGVKEMHNNNIVHRDLKPQNVVMTHGVCKICDFGWAAICQDRRQTYCGTLDYVCPEIIEGSSYDSGVDVWCVGVLAYELMCGKAPFYDISRKKTIEKIKSCKIQSFPNHLSPEAIHFIEMVLTKDPEARIGIEELMNFSFLKSAKQ